MRAMQIKLKFLNAIVVAAASLVSISVFAQGHPCDPQISQCQSAGINAIRPMMRDIVWRGGNRRAIDYDSQPTAGTEAGDRCLDCERGGYGYFKTKVSGTDQRIDEKGNILPNAKLSRQEETKYNGVGMFLCDSTGETGTATLVRKGSKMVFIGSGHVVVPEGDEDQFTDAQMKERFKKYASSCEIIFTDENGTEIDRYKLDVNHAIPGTYKPGQNRELDYVLFEAKRIGKGPKVDLNLLKLVAAPDLSKSTFGRVVAFHHDVLPDGAKIKSEGLVKIMNANNIFKYGPGVVGSTIDTNGWASGAGVLNENDEIYALHLGGKIDEIKSAAGKIIGHKQADFATNSNFALKITPEIIKQANSLAGLVTF